MRSIINLLFILSLTTNFVFNIICEQPVYAQTSQTDAEKAALAVKIDFRILKDDPETELEQLGFSFKKDMLEKDKVTLSGQLDRLQIEASEPAFGLMVNKDINITKSNTVEIEWGVDRYPEGADWSSTLKRDAVMVYLFFGENVDADQFYLPDSPYFIGFFLGEKEKKLAPYVGNNYKETGRYVCLGAPKHGESIRSTFNFADAYKEWFGKSEVPPITGIGIEVDTTDLSNGKSSAFIKHISIFKVE